MTRVKKKPNPSQKLALGIVFGSAIGLAMGNLALGIGVGIAIGAALSIKAKNASNNKTDTISGQDK